MDIYARAPKRWIVFQSIWSNQTFTHREEIGKLLVLKFDHEQRPGFMSIFRYKNQSQNKYILFLAVLSSGFFQINIQKQ